MISIQASVDLSKYTPRAAAFLSLLGPAAKKELHEAAATEVSELLRAHIRAYASKHHTTADTITGGPAARTGHLEDAAESVSKSSVTSDSAEVTISSPGFRRALGPLTIKAKNKPNLTIPIHATAYGKTVADLVADGMRIFRIHSNKTGGDYLAMQDRKGITGSVLGAVKRQKGRKQEPPVLIVLYALKEQVTLKHAPDMLPSETEFSDAARRGVLDVVLMRLGNRGSA